LKLSIFLKVNGSSELQSPVNVSRISGSSDLPTIVYWTSPTFSSVNIRLALWIPSSNGRKRIGTVACAPFLILICSSLQKYGSGIEVVSFLRFAFESSFLPFAAGAEACPFASFFLGSF
jgi:hypothetical protein